MLKAIRDRIVFRRQEEQLFFAAALSELQSGHIRLGVMAKAVSASLGDEQKARALYIKLVVKAMRDEKYMEDRIREQAEQNDKEEIKTAARKAEIEDSFSRDSPFDTNVPRGSTTGIWVAGSVFVAFLIFIGLGSYSHSPDEMTLDRYNEIVAGYEKIYPKIDPESDTFDQKIADKVNNRIQFFEKSGHSSIEALNRAMGELKNTPKSNAIPVRERTTQSKPTESLRPCVFKGVMTNEDYRACGVSPP